MTGARRRPEILAPAGAPECLPAAVAGGADAVYLGLRHFNARGRAANFRKGELPRHIAYLHHHGLKCYLVLNTLVHDDEYAKALDLAATAQAAGADAVIVQDLGLWSVLRRELPGLPLHASTQMTIHHPSQVEVLARLGAERVILARELSLPEIAACAATAAVHGIEVEHFIHGALCYAFSGQCLISNLAGCRSANRGTCAQNCRFDYQVGPQIDTVLSMKDLAAVERIPALAEVGVASFKIEGRLKGPDYVFTASRVYRAAVEAWAAGRPVDVAWSREQLKDVFNRPFTAAALDGGFGAEARTHRWTPALDGEPDARLVAADRLRGELVVRSRRPLTAGQGFGFTVGGFNGGFLITRAEALGRGQWRLRVRLPERGPRLEAGLALFRNRDHARKAEAAAAMAKVRIEDAPEPAVELDLRLEAAPERPLRGVAVTTDGRRVEADDSEPCGHAATRPLDEAQVRAACGALGGSGYRLRAVELALDGSPFVPAARLKALRRVLVERLDACRVVAAAPAWTPPAEADPRPRVTGLWVAVGSHDAARAALDAGAAEAWLDDPALDYWSATPRLDPLGGRLRLRHPATAPLSPRLAELGLPLAAGHLGVLAAAARLGLPVVADHPCNAWSVATWQALGALGATAVVASLELSARDLARLAGRLAAVTAPGLALVVAGRIPAMLTRQDHGLAPGTRQAIRAAPHDGGLPYLLERRRHDTVLWEGRRLCAPAPAALTRGSVDGWVLEFGDLAPAAVGELVVAWRGLLEDRLTASEVAAIQASHAPMGIFPGHLLTGSRELDAVSGARDQDACSADG